ncbi:MAG: hypothetical protein LC667_20410 [Thioalkalivibrio sp.]|nr:hypothetical protein [Thioalkalivibrio sp.]
MHLSPADVREVAPPVMRHRLLPTFRAEAEGKDQDTLINTLLESVAPPRSGLS